MTFLYLSDELKDSDAIHRKTTFKTYFLPLQFRHELNPWEKTHQLRQDLFTFQSDLLLDAVAHRPIKEEKLVNAEKTRNLYRHILWNDFDRYVQFLLFFTCMIKIDKRIQATIINQGFLILCDLVSFILKILQILVVILSTISNSLREWELQQFIQTVLRLEIIFHFVCKLAITYRIWLDPIQFGFKKQLNDFP